MRNMGLHNFSDDELDEWARKPEVMEVLVSLQFAEWLARRDARRDATNKGSSFISGLMITCRNCMYSECCAIKDIVNDDDFFCSQGGLGDAQATL